VPLGDQSRELVLKTSGFAGFARPIHEPSSAISRRIWALAPGQDERARRLRCASRFGSGRLEQGQGARR